MVKILKIILAAVIVLAALAGQSMAQAAGAGAATGVGITPPVAEARYPGVSKITSPVIAPLTGAMGSVYTGGWSGLGGGFIGDFGLQYNTYPCGFGMENWNMFGPLGMYGQYGMYGPFGMYGPAGPSFGSGLGFGGISPDDPWRIYKGYNIARMAEAAAEEKASKQASAAKTAKPAGAPAQGNTTLRS